MNIALWILQVLLAAYFLWHGWLFVAPPAELVEMMNDFIAPDSAFSLGWLNYWRRPVSFCRA